MKQRPGSGSHSVALVLAIRSVGKLLLKGVVRVTERAGQLRVGGEHQGLAEIPIFPGRKNLFDCGLVTQRIGGHSKDGANPFGHRARPGPTEIHEPGPTSAQTLLKLHTKSARPASPRASPS